MSDQSHRRAGGRWVSRWALQLLVGFLLGSDFRAADLPNWPPATSHAMLVRVPDATHVYTGMDLSRLSGALKPLVVVTAADLARAGIRVPEFYAGDLFCPPGKTPLYMGQPVALLIYEHFDAF